MLWQLNRDRTLAAIEVRATNAGLELEPEDGRVFIHPAGKRDQLVTEGHLEQNFQLPPGRYDIRVAFAKSKDHQSKWLTGVTLDEGADVTRQVAFASGELSVEAARGGATGDIIVYLFNHRDHDRVIASMAADEPVLVAPGVYDVRVVLAQEAKEKAVRWRKEVPVRAGLQTKVRVRFQQGALHVVARNGAKELPAGAVALTVYRAGDLDREVVDTGFAGAPLRLNTGRYDIKATFTASNDKPSAWLRDIEIKQDETRETRVAFRSGTAVVSAAMKQGDPLEAFQAYVYFYPAGDHQQPVAYVPASEPVVLASGRYDVRVNYFRSHDRPDLWIRDLVIPAGGQVSRTAIFTSGKLLVRAYDTAGAELLGDNIVVRIHTVGERQRPIAVARSGELLILTEGAYDLVAEDTRGAEPRFRIQHISIAAGGVSEIRLTFEAR